jgi:hypothetical protein
LSFIQQLPRGDKFALCDQRVLHDAFDGHTKFDAAHGRHVGLSAHLAHQNRRGSRSHIGQRRLRARFTCRLRQCR